jgi:hypothetical protein
VKRKGRTMFVRRKAGEAFTIYGEKKTAEQTAID